MIAIERPASEFRGICAALGYRRKKVRVVPTESVRFTGLNWDGGSKNYYWSMNLVNNKIHSHSDLGNPHPMDNQMEGARISIPVNLIMIRTGIFMGKDSIMEIYVRPENMPMLVESAHV